MMPFLIGIDLGTTNTAVAFVDTRRRNARVQLFQVPQLTEPSVVEARPVLPSFLYFGEPHEIESGALALPWNQGPDAIAGVLARERGAIAPGRQVASAKSWLAHPDVDRRAPILPWGVDAGPHISPVDASARYLIHIRDAWNATMASADDHLRLERQRIVLTVPASFDEEARELTVEAARHAQFGDLRLIEEPIAAFYAWIAEHRKTASAALDLQADDGGHIALVCDVGGGTTDFSLIRVGLESGLPSFERVAIGDHLLLGGDNMDLALAALVEERVAAARPGFRLAVTQRAGLRRVCSSAKERMLGDDPLHEMPITILGAGRSVIGESVAVDLRQDEVTRAVEDFLPITPRGAVRSSRDRRAGLRELGLPYETDIAITRHLASFLARSSTAVGEHHRAVVVIDGRLMVRPDSVLFNGGFFTPRVVRDRVSLALQSWFGRAPRMLTAGNLEAAVAIGAATYARLRAGVGPSMSLVKAGSGRAYFIAVRAPHTDGAITAVCVLARGTEEGTDARLGHPFTVTTNHPVSFALYSSAIRSDRSGDIVALDTDEVQQHTSLVTVLRYGRKSRHVELPVRLLVAFTEVGTLELWCESQSSEHRWRLQFQTRNGEEVEDGGPGEAVSTDVMVAEEAIIAAEDAIRSVFDGRDPDEADLGAENLVAHLEKTTGFGKSAWPVGVVRRLADALLAVADGRRRSAPLEARWLNLFGFCIRPGFGAAKDPWRVGEARKVYVAGITFTNSIQNRVEWLVLWQRAAGGFSAGQQCELAQRVMGEMGLSGKKAARLNPQEERESWRLLASLERLDAVARVRFGDEVVRRIGRDLDNVSVIGRLGARAPIYGPLTCVVPPADAARWINQLAALRRMTPDLAAAIVQIGALTGDPLRDVEESVRATARARLRDAGFDDDALRPLFEVVATSAADVNRVFGEPVPQGLRLEIQAGPRVSQDIR